jgi:luciferase family oxidoreductase group 1
MPEGPGRPEVWLLGSSDGSAACAAHFGTAFSFAHFIAGDTGGPAIAQAYVQAFRPSPALAVPRVSVAAFVICAESAAEADRLARSRDLFLLRLHTGQPGSYPSVEEAERYPYPEQERANVRHNRQRSFTGSPAEVRARLLALADEFGAEEVVVVTITHDHKARRRSYELLAGAFALAGG